MAATVIPQVELARKAILWICEQRAQRPDAAVAGLLEEAGCRYNLSPLDIDFLQRFFRENPNPELDAC